MNLDEIEARANAATPGPWTYDEGCGYVEVPPCGAIEFKPGWERSVHFLARVHDNHVEGEDGLGFDGAFIAAARTDVPALVARVRELEAECAKWKTAFENIRRTNTNLMMELFEAQEKARTINIGPVLHENEQLRSHARAVSNLLAIIHGDGGHYEGKHGTVKACKDAEGVVSDLRLKLDAATYALGEKP